MGRLVDDDEDDKCILFIANEGSMHFNFIKTGVINSYRENYACQLGCSRAVEDYNLRLSRLLTPLVEPPALLSSSLTSTSLRLRWDGAPLLPLLPPTTYSLQRRENGGLWETLNASPTNATNFSVINLRPYSVYQSNAMQTLADGLPSAPAVTSIQPISNTSVAITWSPPSAPNGQLVAYRLRLRPHGGLAVIKELPASQKPRGYTFSGLLPTTNYSLALFAVNLEGEGEASQVTFVTPQSVGPLSNGEQLSSLDEKFLESGPKPCSTQIIFDHLSLKDQLFMNNIYCGTYAKFVGLVSN
ncbi:Proto-oncogene tyrosine-protein kinase ROS [Folsomia candida]|uniref:Proto-oncogene tyrosine-protein kinase ROS n=1 Tax=Folsomia candida TaxID=158441 RepID=A0A226E0J6_FOLCA|nr:Proto-oncogene tyrosine-protein kinase ROS [Folsomia candida]